MPLTKNFTLEEMVASDTARRRSIKNEPTPEQIINLENLCRYILQPLRDAYGEPIYVTSGFRSKRLNTVLYGAKDSQHMDGLAADITALHYCDKRGYSYRGENQHLFYLIQQLELPFDQLIDEYGYQWIHVSYSPNPRGEVMHLLNNKKQ